MTAMLDIITKASKLLAAIAVVFILLSLAAFVGAKIANFTPAPTKFVSLGPTVRQLESLGQLTTMRVHVADVLSAHGEGYRGSWLIKGDALLACDMRKARIVERDDQSKTAVVELALPTVMSPRVDHEKTKTWSVEKATWIPWKWGDENVFRDSAMYHAQKLVEHAASLPENRNQAKVQAELLIRKTYELVDWHVTVVWQ